MQEEFTRTERMLGADAMERLRNSRVAVFGIGGSAATRQRHLRGRASVLLT